MWCKNCRQDVPAFASPHEAGYCCPRCGEVVALRAHDGHGELPASDDGGEMIAPLPQHAPPDHYAWELNEQLRHVERVLSRGRHRVTRTQDNLRIDPPMPVRPTPAPQPSSAELEADSEEGSLLSALAWSATCAGVTGLTCGIALLVFAWSGGRGDLWRIGLPILIGGQLVLSMGLGLHAAGRSRRHAHNPHGNRSNAGRKKSRRARHDRD